jgi:hypothetical protein
VRLHAGGVGRVNSGVLVDVRRGEALDTLELIDDAGTVLLAHAHGVHDDERLRTREVLLRLLRGALDRRPA